MRTKQSEKGQILILFVLGLIGLLGLTALAIDGGMVYSDRRFDQSVSDASAYAGASAVAGVLENGVPGYAFTIRYQGFKCPPVDANGFSIIDISNPDASIRQTSYAMLAARQAVVDRAADNGFPGLEHHIGNNYGVAFKCNDASLYGVGDKYIDIYVHIKSDTQTAFAHLVFNQNQIRNVVESVVRIRPRTAAALGNAIVAMDPENDCTGNNDGINFSGSTTTYVSGGGVFSNSCLDTDGGMVVDVDDGGAYYVYGDYREDGSGTIDPDPTKITEQLPSQTIPPPDCGTTAGTITQVADPDGQGKLFTYSPGIYSSIVRLNNSNDQIVLQPGLYCFDDGMAINGQALTGANVTLFFRGGGISINSTTVTNLSAPTEGNVVGNAMKGMLIFLAPGNSSDVTINGSAESHFTGTIYAPESAIYLGGSQASESDPKFSTQVIGYTVKVSGDSRLDIYYDQSQAYENPANLNGWR